MGFRKRNAKKRDDRSSAKVIMGKPASKLTKEEKKILSARMAEIRSEKGGKNTVQNTIPFLCMYQDGVCQVSENFFSLTVQFFDANYSIAEFDEQNNIFSKYCDVINLFDNTIRFQLTFENQNRSKAKLVKTVQIPEQDDDFNSIRKEYSEMLTDKLLKGSNGQSARKFLTFGIESTSYKAARAKLISIKNDVIKGFKAFGVEAEMLDGKQRLEALYYALNPYRNSPFLFDWGEMLRAGMDTKDFICPPSLKFNKSDFEIGNAYGAVWGMNILAGELPDEILKDFLEMQNLFCVNIHVEPLDQIDALKFVKKKLTVVEAMKVDEQKKASQAGYDTDILPPAIKMYIEDIDKLLADLNSKNERLFHWYDNQSRWEELSPYNYWGGGNASSGTYYRAEQDAYIYDGQPYRYRFKPIAITSELSQYEDDDGYLCITDGYRVLDPNDDYRETGFFIMDHRWYSGTSHPFYYIDNDTDTFFFMHGGERHDRSFWGWDGTDTWFLVSPTDTHIWNSSLNDVCMYGYYEKYKWKTECKLYYNVKQNKTFDEVIADKLSSMSHSDERLQYYALLVGAEDSATMYGNHQTLHNLLPGATIRDYSLNKVDDYDLYALLYAGAEDDDEKKKITPEQAAQAAERANGRVQSGDGADTADTEETAEDGEDATDSAAQAKPVPMNKNSMMLVFGAIALIGVGGAGFFIIKKKNGGGNSKSAMQVEPEYDDDNEITEDEDDMKFYDDQDDEI